MRLSSYVILLFSQLKSRDKGRVFDLRICTSVIKGDDSNMAILEVNAPSGYVFDQEELETLRLQKVFKRYETEDKDSKVNLYFNSITSRDECVNLQAYRVYLVAKHSDATALVYDYYDTTRRAQEFYKVPTMPLCDLCDVDDSCEIKNCA
jgi:CD109 antigen